MNDAAVALCALAMAIGLVGVVIPLLPGLLLVWLAALGYGIVAGFGAVGAVAFGVITLLFAASVGAKWLLPHRRGRAGGAPLGTMMVGAVAAVVGFFVVPVVGLPLGLVVGVLVAEYLRARSWSTAWRSTRAVVVGVGIAVAFEFAAGVAMVAAWAAWVLLAR